MMCRHEISREHDHLKNMNDIGPPAPVGVGQHAMPRPVFGLIVDHIRDGICLQDIHGRIEWANPACEAMFGWPLAELRGRFARELLVHRSMTNPRPRSGNFVYDFNSRIFREHIVQECQRRDGSRFWSQHSFAVLELGPGDDQKKIVVTCRDITDQVRADLQLSQVRVNLEYAAYHDDLTGLANRKRLNEFLSSRPVAQAITDRTVGILQIDLDKFKDINDTMGHAAGDAVLCHVAEALKDNCGPDNLACRTGGDEFLFVCLSSGQPEILRKRAETLLEAITTPLIWNGKTVHLGASIGASTAAFPGDTGEAMIVRADKALYSAKHGGRGRVAIYTEALGRKYQAEQTQARDLKEALSKEQFEIYLQPQLCLARGVVTGCEALIRWRHPTRGLLTPDQFLPAAENAGLSTELDYTSMNLALDALVALRNAGYPDLSMAINVCSSILSDVNYPGLLRWALQSRDIEAPQVCIEILETTILEGGGLEIATAIERLRHLGVRIALDDFGTGYAGLAHMSAFDVDAIKLDRSMIARLASDPRNRIIIRTIIRLCAQLRIKVVAEGVETNEQLEILRRANCPLIQGFGLARPMPVDRMLTWLREKTPLPAPVSFPAQPCADTVALPPAARDKKR